MTDVEHSRHLRSLRVTIDKEGQTTRREPDFAHTVLVVFAATNLAGRSRDGHHATFKCRDAVLERLCRRVHDTSVDITKLLGKLGGQSMTSGHNERLSISTFSPKRFAPCSAFLKANDVDA